MPTSSQTHTTQTQNDGNERDRLVLQHLPLVRAIAVRVYENLPVHVDLDDLIHAGILGLFDAATMQADEAAIDQEITAAFDYARASNFPPPSEMARYTYPQMTAGRDE